MLHNRRMDTATEFSRLLGPLRRAVMKKAREAASLPDLPDAQISLLRLIAESGGVTPGAAAARFRVAPSTISNLVRSLRKAELVERTALATDLRTVKLTASTRAHDLLNCYDRVSAAAIKQASKQLSATQQSELQRAIPVLRALLGALE